LAAQQNPLLQAQVINNNIAKLNLKQVRAGRYPTIVATTGYQFNESESSLGFTTSASARGWNYGLSARLNIFDGFNQGRNERIALIQIEQSEIGIEQKTVQLLAQLNRAYQTYLTNVILVALESNNQQIARENLYITEEKFTIGTIPTIAFTTAQL